MLYLKAQSVRFVPYLMSVIAIFAIWSCQSEPTPPLSKDPSDNIVVNWQWKRTVKGETNFIYGALENKNNQALKQVVLAFRTQDKQGKTLMERSFTLEDVPARGQKLFTEDYPAHAEEDSGFVNVTKVIVGE